MTLIELADSLRPWADRLMSSAAAGDTKASQVISLYEMHRRCPSDSAAPALCEAAFDDWLRAISKDQSNA